MGRSHECDYPFSIRRLPVLTATNIDVSASSAEIDRQVKAQLASGHPLFRVNVELMRQLKPDLVITQTHCEVCAVSQKDVLAAVGTEIKVLSLKPETLADLWVAYQEIGQALGATDKAAQEIARVSARMEAIAAKSRDISENPRVVCIEWLDPLMSAGNWIPELVKMAGGVNLFGEAGKHSPWIKWEDLIRQDPDFIFVLPCGFDIQRTRAEMLPLKGKKPWAHLKATMHNRVVLFDGNQYLNRPGPRLLDSLEMMAEVLHEGYFDFGHKHEGWEYW